MLKKILFLFIAPLFCFGADENLKRGDIQKVMDQILQEHVDKKTVSQEVLKNALLGYIEQFDKEKIYFLKSEVEPYFQMSSSDLNALEKQYRAGDYSSFEKLNDLIQKAISRARAYRSGFEEKPKDLYKEATTSKTILEFNYPEYAASENELKGRIQKELIHFLQMEIKHFGEKGVLGYEGAALKLFEKQVRAEENLYAYRKEDGKSLSQSEEESLFTLHVLKALAKSLDAHTAFFDSQEAYEMRVRLEKGFEGIGIVFQESPRGVVVSHLLEGSPAAKNGQIKVGDILIEINSTKASEVSFEKIMDMLRGEKGEDVSLVFQRPGDKDAKNVEIRVTLKRDTIVMKNARVDVTKENFGGGIIGHITLHSFYQNDTGVTSEKDVRDAITQLNQEGNLRGLILDLRENSGGFLSQAVKVAGLFITNGVVVISKYSSGDEKIYRDMDSRVFYKGPLIVLTSRATASAAEIVAQALQDYGVALIVGDDHTYGKGTIQSQTVTDHKGAGSYFKVTVGEYFTVSGKTPQLQGVKADIEVPGPYSQVRFGEEYLEHTVAKKDKIAAKFQDPLKDIDPALKPWYMKYYMPTLQSQDRLWRDIVPQLKKNSSHRLASNKNYQAFMKRLAPHADPEEPSNFGNEDFQLVEANNIVKDMIYLETRARQKEYMVGSESSDGKKLPNNR